MSVVFETEDLLHFSALKPIAWEINWQASTINNWWHMGKAELSSPFHASMPLKGWDCFASTCLSSVLKYISDLNLLPGGHVCGSQACIANACEVGVGKILMSYVSPWDLCARWDSCIYHFSFCTPWTVSPLWCWHWHLDVRIRGKKPRKYLLFTQTQFSVCPLFSTALTTGEIFLNY